MLAKAVTLDYTNWRGERTLRRVVPLSLLWSATSHHAPDQWLLRCWDLEKEDWRVFAMVNIHSWT